MQEQNEGTIPFPSDWRLRGSYADYAQDYAQWSACTATVALSWDQYSYGRDDQIVEESEALVLEQLRPLLSNPIDQDSGAD